MRFLRLLPVLLLLLAPVACSEDDPTEPSTTTLELRIQNGTEAALEVVATGAEDGTVVDFGTVAAGATTDFRAMEEQFTLTLDGEPYTRGDGGAFGIDDTPTSQWTLSLLTGGGWSLDAYFGG